MSIKQKVKGCQDLDPVLFSKTLKVINSVRKNAINMGAKEIETPIMEYKDVLMEKYGDDEKLIFNLQNSPNETVISLRYDLTVPFSRYIMNNNISNMKKLQIGNVFRADNPYPNQGRYCQFIQADYDIIGERNLMMAEIEILKLINLVMNDLEISNYEIRINFRQNLEDIFRQCNVDVSDIKNFQSYCSSIDKLDKVCWDYIREELQTKGLTIEQLDKVQKLIEQNYISKLLIDDYNKLNELMKVFNITNVKFDTSLARGLDYYTGLIYEVKLTSNNKYKMGSIIAGGRYDKLISFTKKKEKHYVNAIGVCFGVSRISQIVENNEEIPRPKSIYIVTSKGNDNVKFMLVNMFWENNFEVGYNDNSRKNVKEINYGIMNNYEFILIYGENDELIRVKKNDQSQDKYVKLENILECVNNFESYKQSNQN